MARLYRDGDGAGHYGCVTESIDPDTLEVVGTEPEVGRMFKVGTMTASTYGNRDWWRTTPVTEIIRDNEYEVRFRTRNSIYTFER